MRSIAVHRYLLGETAVGDVATILCQCEEVLV